MAKKEQVPAIRFQGFADPWEQRKFNDVFSILQNCTLSRAELSYDNGEAFNIHYGDVLIKFGEVIPRPQEPRRLQPSTPGVWLQSVL